MCNILQIGNHIFQAEAIIPMLATYGLMPQVLRESIIDQAIASINCTPDEIQQAIQTYYQHRQLTSEAQRHAWQAQYGLKQEQLIHLATRQLRLEKFKRETWGHTLKSYFLKRKHQLDQVIYALLRTQDPYLIYELHFRLQAGESSFSDLAREYSEGPESATGGLLGPVELGSLHPKLAALLGTRQVRQLGPPLPFGEWHVLVRVEKCIPARFDEAMRERLLQEQFETWLRQQIDQLSQQDKQLIGLSAGA
ncbi:MAG: peptidylprolyl isomerase [Cyanobacteria bacterium P01_D01_bin.44]